MKIHRSFVLKLLLIAVTIISVVGFQEKDTSTLHPKLNELDSIDEFDEVIGSVKIGPSGFDHQLNTSEYHMVLFYAPWCEYCLKILPEWTEATQMMMDRKFSDLVQFAHVDCISEEEFCSRLDITDYPTIRTYMRGPPRRFELVYPYLLEDTVEYMKDYLLNSTDNSDDSDDT
ncbi:protein disulfide-isomerase A4-like isoform X2 [Armigeres subalbatus]|uniref:protein disulfide-isomerase A4-like isoform X2 n=1 Tax=Armigeres subalbatus TaxID=124917 RepID=UPI002ED113A3